MAQFEKIIDNFIDKVEDLYQPTNNFDDGFSAEFFKIKQQSSSLKKDPDYESSAGEDFTNKKKNRYKDILPFDYSRVRLPPSDPSLNDDYINASFIKGANKHKSYIASQGPLPHTVNDFWRMLWHYNIKVIIMVCREVELGKRKCERYWAGENNEPKQFLDIKVTLDSEKEIRSGIFQRNFTATKGSEQRSFFQLQYVAWPDHGTPRTREEILSMINSARKVQTRDQDQKTPLCVHCSAGCGRTGAILVIDYFQCLLKQKKLPQNLTVYDVVVEMRKQRPAIVQTKEQYEFVHLAVSEMFTNYLKESSGKAPTSKLSAALTSQNYENIVIQPSPPCKPKLTKQYENVTEFKRETPVRGSPPRGSPPSKPHRPVSSFEPLDKKLHTQKDVRKTSMGVINLEDKRKFDKPVHVVGNNLRKKKSFEQASPSTKPKPSPRPQLTGYGVATPTTTQQGKLVLTTVRHFNLPQNKLHDKPKTPEIKPKPKLPTKPKPQVVKVSESVQERKARLWSQSNPPDNLSKSKTQISSSAVDLRTIHKTELKSRLDFTNRAYEKNVAVENKGDNSHRVSTSTFLEQDLKNKTKNNNNNNFKPELKIIEKKTALKPPSKPPTLPKKSFRSKNPPPHISNRKEDKVVNPKEDKQSYANVVAKKPNPLDYTHININNQFEVEGEYDLLKSSMKRGVKTFGNPDKKYSGNTKPVTKSLSDNSEPVKFTGNTGKVARPVSTFMTFMATPYSRSNLSSTSSNVFDSPSPGESPNKKFPEFDLHGCVDVKKDTPTHGPTTHSNIHATKGGAPHGPTSHGFKPKVPPTKPSRQSFKTTNQKVERKTPGVTGNSPKEKYHVKEDLYSQTNKSKNYYSMVPLSDDQYSFPNENQPKIESQYEEVQINSVDQVNSISSNSFSSMSSSGSGTSNKQRSQPQFTPSPTQEHPPSLPNRTPESYQILEVSTNKGSNYEELAPSHEETGRRSSGASSLATKMKEMKESVAKTTTAISGKMGALQHNLKINKSVEDDPLLNRPRKTYYQQEPTMIGGQDISFNKRLHRKPKGPQQKPNKWP